MGAQKYSLDPLVAVPLANGRFLYFGSLVTVETVKKGTRKS